MKKFFCLIVLLLLFFLACKGNIESNGVSNTKMSKEELEKLREPTENVVALKDDFSGTEYVLQSIINPNDSSKYILRFDKETNKTGLVMELFSNSEKLYEVREFVCLRQVDDNNLRFDFTPFETYANKYNINIFLDEQYIIFKDIVEREEKKSNRTEKEEKMLKIYKEYLSAISSVEKYKQYDPELRFYHQIKLRLERSAEVFKEMNPIGAISSDKSTITFPKFFFLDFHDDDYKYPMIKENIVFKKR